MQFNPIVPWQSLFLSLSSASFFWIWWFGGQRVISHRAPAAPYHVARACRMFVVTGKRETCLWTCSPEVAGTGSSCWVDVEEGHAQGRCWSPRRCASLYVCTEPEQTACAHLRTQGTRKWIDVCVHLRTHRCHGWPNQALESQRHSASLPIFRYSMMFVGCRFTKFVVPPHGGTTANLR